MSDQEDIGHTAVRRAGMEHKGDFRPAANLLTQLARGWAAGTAGLPGDLEGLARLAQKYTTLNPAIRNLDTTPVLPTSDFYKEWLPGRDEAGMGAKALTDIGSLFGGMGAGTLARGAAQGAKATGRGALSAVDAALRNAAAPRQLSTQAGVIKAPGGNWRDSSVENMLRGLKRNTIPDPRLMQGDIPPNIEPLNNWVDKQLNRYIRNDMATERDPLRALAERGVSHIPQQELDIVARDAPFNLGEFRSHVGFPPEGLAKSDSAKGWETLSDSAINAESAEYLIKKGLGENYPWLHKLEPNQLVYGFIDPGVTNATADVGFGHLLDELRNATNPASGLPANLLLDSKSLPRLSVPDAVQRVHNINAWRADNRAAADAALANNPATHVVKEYPHTDATPNPQGLRWVELKMPEGFAPGETQDEWGDLGRYGKTKLSDALSYEGDTMGHCVGGYCDDVAEGRSRILSLRDAKGQPHVTVEVEPSEYEKLRGDPAYAKVLEEDPSLLAGSIVQIKGKANRAPNAEYLPFVQDLVRGGLGGDLTNWERVGDLSNAGLRRKIYAFNPNELERIKRYGIDVPDYLTDAHIQEINDKVWPVKKFATGGPVPSNPYTIDAAAFHAAVDPLLGGANMWQAHDDSPQKLALQLGNGATWNVGGGEGTYGSGVYKYDPITEADDKRYQEALAAYNATGLATFNPDNIAVGSGSKADRDNMLESWLGSGGAIGGLRTGAQGFDVGDAGRVEGHTPTAEEWAAALAKDAPGYDPAAPLYRVRGDMSQLLGKPDSRMFLDVGYQEIDGRMVPLGTPSRTYQKSVGAENISMLSALLAPYAVGTALTNAAAGGGSAMAQAATEANAANAAQGFGQLGVAGAAPAAGIGEQAIAAYQAAQPYLKAANTVGAVARGNPMGALGGYLPGMDLGLGDFGNTVANGAVKAGLSGGNPLLGAVAGAAGEVIPTELRQYLPMAQSLVAATEGKLSLTQALNMLARYNSSSKGA